MQHDSKKYLYDIQQAALRIQRFTTGKALIDYKNDDLLQSAVERQFEIIGEAVNQLAKLTPELAASLPEFQKMIAFRNLLIHGYFAIDPVIVWGVVEKNIAPLLKVLDQHLGEN